MTKEPDFSSFPPSAQRGANLMKKATAALGIVGVGLAAAYLTQDRAKPRPLRASKPSAVSKKVGVKPLNCCAYTMKEGILGRLRKSTVVIRGVASQGDAGENGPRFSLNVEKVLIGQEPAVTVSLFGSLNDPHISVNQQALYFLNPIQGGYSPLAAVPTQGRSGLRLEAAILALKSYQDKNDDATTNNAATAMFEAYKVGSPGIRDMISRDFAKQPQLIRQLDTSQVDELLTILGTMSGNDASLGGLILMLGYRHDHGKTRAALVACVDKEKADRAFPILLRVMQKRDPGAYSAALLTKWENTELEAVRERMAKILARLDTVAARTHLKSFLVNSASPQLQAEALIAHAGQADGLGKSLALDVIRKHLKASATDEEGIAKIMRDRQRRSIQQELPTGERYRLMAAGFYLAQMKDEKVLAWLKSKIRLLDDAGSADFIQDRLANRWSNFDAPF